MQEALCTAPATRKAAAAPAATTCATPPPCRRLCVLRLPRERQPRPQWRHARRSSSKRLCVLHLPRKRQPLRAAPPGGSVYCTCHAKGSRGPAVPTRAELRQEALCTAPATQAAAGQRPPRAPQLLQALCTAPATQKAAAGSGAHPPRSSARRLCVLHLPRKRQPWASDVHVGQRRPHTPQLLREALHGSCACHAKGSSARRLTCHAKGSRGPPAPTRARRLCVLRL